MPEASVRSTVRRSCRVQAAEDGVRAHILSRLASPAHLHELHEHTAPQAADAIAAQAIALLLWVSEPQQVGSRPSCCFSFW